MAMKNPVVVTPTVVEEIDEDTTTYEDLAYDSIYENTPAIYSFEPGLDNINSSYADILEWFTTCATSNEMLDYQLYCEFLEHFIFRMLEDLWLASQIIGASAVGYLTDTKTAAERPMLRILNNKLATSKFFGHYIFGESLNKLNVRATNLEHSFDFDDLVKMFDHLPDNLKAPFMEYMTAQGKRIFPDTQ